MKAYYHWRKAIQRILGMKREQLLRILKTKFILKLFNDKQIFENASNLRNICMFFVKYSCIIFLEKAIPVYLLYFEINSKVHI